MLQLSVHSVWYQLVYVCTSSPPVKTYRFFKLTDKIRNNHQFCGFLWSCHGIAITVERSKCVLVAHWNQPTLGPNTAENYSKASYPKIQGYKAKIFLGFLVVFMQFFKSPCWSACMYVCMLHFFCIFEHFKGIKVCIKAHWLTRRSVFHIIFP